MTERYEDLARFEIGPYTRSSKAVFRKTDTKPPFQPKELSNRPEHDLSDNYALCGKETPSLPPVTQHNTFSTANGWSLFQLPEWSLFRLPQTMTATSTHVVPETGRLSFRNAALHHRPGRSMHPEHPCVVISELCETVEKLRRARWTVTPRQVVEIQAFRFVVEDGKCVSFGFRHCLEVSRATDRGVEEYSLARDFEQRG